MRLERVFLEHNTHDRPHQRFAMASPAGSPNDMGPVTARRPLGGARVRFQIKHSRFESIRSGSGVTLDDGNVVDELQLTKAPGH